jgi:hypothetical protein
MSREPEQETFAELTRLPKPDTLLGAHHHARKMIAAVAKEAGINNDSYNNIEAAEAIREIIDASLPTHPKSQAIAAAAARPTLPENFPTAPAKATEVTEGRFQARAIEPEQSQRIVAIRAAFEAVETIVTRVLAAGRYRALVLTALEEACMWAVKAVSHENG